MPATTGAPPGHVRPTIDAPAGANEGYNHNAYEHSDQSIYVPDLAAPAREAARPADRSHRHRGAAGRLPENGHDASHVNNYRDSPANRPGSRSQPTGAGLADDSQRLPGSTTGLPGGVAGR